MPRFSIITVCYNSGKTLARTMNSVLSQDFKDYEYIVVDGASKDRTVDIIKDFEQRFEGRLAWKSERDKGIYDAFNKGIARSKGEYIWMVNSDDFIEPGALSYLDGFIADNGNPAIISAALRFCDSQGKEIRIARTTPEQSETEFRKKMMGLVHPATVVRKDIYRDVAVYDDRFYISADMDWFLTIREKGIDVLFDDKVITNMTDGGVSNQGNLKKRIHDWNILVGKHEKSWMKGRLDVLKRILSFAKHRYIGKKKSSVA